MFVCWQCDSSSGSTSMIHNLAPPPHPTIP
jgi:hypothetical protein